MFNTGQQPIIELINVSKKYSLNGKDFWALKNINLKIFPGERVGIIGSNGAGKSTLLKVISGITKPTSGTVVVKEEVASIMNLDSGFHPDLTGAENIYIVGMLSGMSRKDIVKSFNKIVSFANIKSFINNPIFTYSSGMKFRLAFAIATASLSRIIILDEVFFSGDISFQKKSLSLIKKLQSKKDIATVICSHVPYLIWELSNSFYEMKSGHLFKISDKKVAKVISQRNSQRTRIFSSITNSV